MLAVRGPRRSAAPAAPARPMPSSVGDPTKIGETDARIFLQHPLGGYSEPGGSGELAPISLVTTTKEFNLTSRGTSTAQCRSRCLPTVRKLNCGSLKQGKLDRVRGQKITRGSYPRARQSNLRVEALSTTPAASAVAIASSNFASVMNVYQIDPDLSITKSYFRNVALAVMRFKHAERRDQNA